MRAPTTPDYVAAAQSLATTRSYAVALQHFKSAGGAFPASPAVVAAYLAEFAGKLAVATLQHRLIAIHRAHKDAGLASPVMDVLVKRTMQGIRRTFGVAQRRVHPLMKDDLVELMVTTGKQKPLKAARDKALLLVGFAGAFRRSELVALRCEDVTEHDAGLEFLLRRSKTDQEGQGRTVFVPHGKAADRCPVKALKHYLGLAGIAVGPLFRRVNRHDRLVGDGALTAQSVALVVKAAVRRGRGGEAAESFSAHSLRAGWCTEAATVGLLPHLMKEVTGHRSDATLARYIRPVAKRKIPSLL